MPVTATFLIPSHRSHVPTARQRVRKTLADWGITGELADDITLSANELVTNAVIHCWVSDAQVRVTLALQGAHLLLEVHDPDRDRIPRAREHGPDTKDGRGLALVGQLAHSWGHTRQPHTKSVWARFALPVPEEPRVPTGA
ncbi:ATP-binding protein [Streptomyces kroppenstedtii]|jgi:anti-sigma regulatory factor (Ser/Thr protein kinase)|uniref:ATP-binding protein n=1 Tax=Streptomyces kroppenstedtii TaxID=3051181 RepID=UPI0028D54691|nr:ATP-binding protein [Streptomyces sp. DSM 40484]